MQSRRASAHHDRSTQAELGDLALEDLLVQRSGSKEAINNLLKTVARQQKCLADQSRDDSRIASSDPRDESCTAINKHQQRHQMRGAKSNIKAPCHSLKIGGRVPIAVKQDETRSADDCER